MLDFIPILNRVCDLCNAVVTDRKDVALRSFVLTSWGVICLACWDERIIRHADFEIVKTYAKSQRVEDPWIRSPMVLYFPHDARKREAASTD